MRVSQLVKPNYVIRFVGYEPKQGVPDEAFVAARRAIASYADKFRNGMN